MDDIVSHCEAIAMLPECMYEELLKLGTNAFVVAEDDDGDNGDTEKTCVLVTVLGKGWGTLWSFQAIASPGGATMVRAVVPSTQVGYEFMKALSKYLSRNTGVTLVSPSREAFDNMGAAIFQTRSDSSVWIPAHGFVSHVSYNLLAYERMNNPPE